VADSCLAAESSCTAWLRAGRKLTTLRNRKVNFANGSRLQANSEMSTLATHGHVFLGRCEATMEN
jgi:hypothetical protein